MSESCKGTLVLWNDEKGFGFIRTEVGEKDFFVHISAIKNYRKGLSRRPMVGDIVHFKSLSAAELEGQRRIAHATVTGINDAVFGVDGNPEKNRFVGMIQKFLAGAPILLSFYVIWRSGNPIPLVSYIFMSALSSRYYALDKRQALTQGWRIPEIYLHGFELLGGWPGALLAQKAFRHKHKKGHYQRIFWAIVGLHGMIWAVYLYFDLVTGKSLGFK